MKTIDRKLPLEFTLSLLCGGLLLCGCGTDQADKELLTYESPETQSVREQPQKEPVSTRPDITTTAPEQNVAANTTIAATEQLTAERRNTARDANYSVRDVDLPKQSQREVKLLVPENSFHLEGTGTNRALRVSYEDLDLLKVLNMEPVTLDAVEQLPQWLKDLDGKRIRLRGYMRPPFSATDISVFAFVRDPKDCCFGSNPKPYDIARVVLREGVTTDYIVLRPFDVVGRFHIELLSYDNKKVDGLYSIDDAVIIQR